MRRSVLVLHWMNLPIDILEENKLSEIFSLITLEPAKNT